MKKVLTRPFAALIAVLALAIALVACGSDDSSKDGGNSAAVQAESGALPVTIKHKFGETKIEKAPTRVVSLGYTDQDALLALGVTPIAVRNWEGMTEKGKPAGKWALDKIKGEQPQIIMSDTISLGEVAALRPDLIIGVYSDIEKPMYDQLSKVAPVVVQSGDYPDYQQPWDVTTEEIGKAVGKPAEAKKLVDGVKKKISDLAGRHPNWKGKSASIATFDGKELAAFAGADTRVEYLKALGFTSNPKVDAAAEKGKFYASISIEEARMLDTDLVIWDQLSYAPEGKQSILKQQVLANLPAVKDNRSVFLEGELEKAFGWQTVLSLDYVTDNIEKPLADAVK